MIPEDPVVEEFEDILRSVEAAILEVWAVEPDLLDAEVADALVALIRQYEAEQAGRQPSPSRLSPRATVVLKMVRLVCDWQSGKTPDDPRASKLPPAPENPLPIPDLLRCLNRLRKSVRFWNKEGGR